MLSREASTWCARSRSSRQLPRQTGYWLPLRAPGRQIAVNHEFREMPIYRAVRERIGDADVGRLVFCQIWQLMDLAPWDEPVAWRAAMPNRTLFEGGVHLVDLLMTLFGEKPSARVRATFAAGSSPDARRTRSTS